MQWSYDLLEPDERDLLRRLSVLAGAFDLELATALAAEPASQAPESEAADALDGLVERSMVVLDRSAGASHARFRLLDTIRDFAAEALDRSGQRDQVHERLASWVLARLDDLHPLLVGPEEVDGVARLQALRPHLRVAVEHAVATGDHELLRALLRPIVGEVLLRSDQEVGDWCEQLLAIAPPDDVETRAFALAWVGHRCGIAQDPEHFERVAAEHGEPDHVLVVHARAFATDDGERLLTAAPAAEALLRERGEDDLAEHAAIDVGGALLGLGRFAEHDAAVESLVARYRAQGPPTLCNWALMLLVYSATFAGDEATAQARFEEAIAIPLPARTHSPSRPIEARTAFRQGDRARAFRVLRQHVDELVATENSQGALIAAVELANMLVEVDHVPEAARLLQHLETTGLLDEPGFREMVAPAAKAVAAAGLAEPTEPPLDDQQALARMADLLRDLDAATGNEP